MMDLTQKKTHFDVPWQEAVLSLETSASNGLTAEESRRRLERYGPNKLREGKKKTIFQLFLAQLNDPLIFILLIAAGISGFLGEISDMAIIALVVVLNAVIGVSQESRAEKAMEELKKLSTPRAYVVRDGVTAETDSESLVPGDVVLLDAGRFIPCDLRLIESANLRVDESALTGESVPVDKDAELVLSDTSVPLGDRRNMAYSSTLVTSGRGRGVVVATGMDTEIGRIAGMLEEREERTPLQKKLAETGRLLGVIALSVCAAMFALALLQKRDLFEMFMTAISLAVAAIPEGMPAIVSIVLAIGVQRMARKNAIIRKLPSVETLGAVDVICSDKTGTLTQNRMTVLKYWVDGEVLDAAELRVEDAAHRTLLEAIVLCNDATSNEDGSSTGDPTEVALIEAGKRHGVEASASNERHRRVNELPFDSGRKLMSTIHVHGDGYRVMTKGAADNLLNRCVSILREGKALPLTDEIRAEVSGEAGKMSDAALRVLGAAYKDTKESDLPEDEIEQGLTFIGLVAMMDPPRLEVKDSIETCKKAGITTVMITGDHPRTAFAIAQELGIAESPEQTMPGTELDRCSDEELADRIGSIRVFSRVSPEHKVRIVKALKSLDNVVSMTGDGVNDAPSLKAADIGVAMGITGTDVAKGASDMILTDDNFATIVTAVEEGRNIFANIKRAILFLLSCNIGEIVALFLAVLLGWPVPLQAVHLLWVNLITDTFPALSLGVEPGDPDVMKEKPQRSTQSLFKGSIGFLAANGLLIGVLTLSAFVIGAMRYTSIHDLSILTHMMDLEGPGNPIDKEGLQHARSMAFVVLAVSQLFFAFALRSRTKGIFSLGLGSNRSMLLALFVGIVIQVGVIHISFMARIFKVVPLNSSDWFLVLALSVVPLCVSEIVKALRRQRLQA